MSAAAVQEPSEATTRSSVARVILALWVSVCALSLLLIVFTIGFHLSTRHAWYVRTFHPWRMLTVLALGAIGVPILGAFIVWRRPGNRNGRVCVRIGAGRGRRRPGLPGLGVVCRTIPAGWVGGGLAGRRHGVADLRIGPAGAGAVPGWRAPTPRWRPVVWATLVVCAAWTLATAVAINIEGMPNPILWLPGPPGEVAVVVADRLGWANLLLTALGALSVLARYRRARGRERQQVKWLAYVVVPLLASLVVLVKWAAIGLLGAVYIAAVLWAIYLAIGIAVLRHHLYDIDRLINRTLVYGLLTVVLALVYAGGVFLLGRLLNPAGGESALAVAASTLAVAALFQPLRRRGQTAVDRRFNRSRYDGGRTVEAFSGRLRDEIDLDTLSAELLAVVDQTMQPTQVSVWLQPAVGQVGPMIQVAGRAAPAAGRRANQPGPGRGRPTVAREGGT